MHMQIDRNMENCNFRESRFASWHSEAEKPSHPAPNASFQFSVYVKSGHFQSTSVRTDNVEHWPTFTAHGLCMSDYIADYYCYRF